MLGKDMNEHLEEIGRRLYAKISEQLKAEVEAITEDDCIRKIDRNHPRRGRPLCLPMILGNHRGLPLQWVCPMLCMGLKPMTTIILVLPFRTMFMGTYPL
jgi:hypothetical protein